MFKPNRVIHFEIEYIVYAWISKFTNYVTFKWWLDKVQEEVKR